MLYISYTVNDNQIRLVLDPLLETAVLPLECPHFSKVADPAFCSMALDYSHRPLDDGNGMSEVFILSDGSYLIYDGGYCQDADQLYRFLEQQNRRNDGKIVIAGWFLTHSHPDHYLCLDAFMSNHAKDVTVEAFIANPPSLECMGENKGGYDSYLAKYLPNYAEKCGAKLYILHAGQRMILRDALIEALFGFELCLPNTFHMNASSMVTCVTINGERVLLLADAELIADRILPLMYGDALKCDILQASHHSYSGGSIGEIDFANPKYAVFTTSQTAFDLRRQESWINTETKYLTEKIGLQNCYPADNGNTLFKLSKRLPKPKKMRGIIHD